uniref:Formimidoyltransferase-cyclodeaminase n=1 Tax=Denticeps clupeoides TaxID=299321 RepID=A0AAY4CHA3_9TELE
MQPAGRGSRGLHQPHSLHIRRVPRGSCGGGTECGTHSLSPHRHDQTLRWTVLAFHVTHTSSELHTLHRNLLVNVVLQESTPGLVQWMYAPSSLSRIPAWKTRCWDLSGQTCGEKVRINACSCFTSTSAVYLYGEAARKESRRSLPAVRAGEYEALPEKLKKSEWAPDFGPATFVPSWGATVTGARKFLVAYNVNLLSTKEQAHRIALDIREQGRGKDQPGLLKKVQGMGWYLDEASLAQVSTNILDFELTPVHTVYEEICRFAKELSLPVVGSQIVGLIPLKAMLDCADFYMQKENLFIVEEEHKVRLVISKLGLDSLGPFVPKERIIEYMVDNTQENHLVSQPLQQFVRSVGARTAAPGGGSVSAAVAAMGAALGAMVGQMTYGKRQFESLDCTMRRLIPPFHQAMNDLLVMVDTDSSAFNSYMAALKMPKNSPDEVKRRDTAMQDGLKKAVGVPISLAERVNLLWPCLKELVLYGNVACKSDLQVAAKALETAVFGAYFNVIINLKDIRDESFKLAVSKRATTLLEKARECTAAVLDAADRRQ